MGLQDWVQDPRTEAFRAILEMRLQRLVDKWLTGNAAVTELDRGIASALNSVIDLSSRPDAIVKELNAPR